MIEMLLMILLIGIIYTYRKNNLMFVISNAFFFYICRYYWQGWYFFAVFECLFIITYELMITRRKDMIFYAAITFSMMLSVWLLIMKFPAYMMLVAEMQPDIMHFLYPEFIIMILIIGFCAKQIHNKDNRLLILMLITLFCCLIIPRTMLFCVIMISLACPYIRWKDKKVKIIASYCIIGLIAFWAASLIYFETDHFTDIEAIKDPCYPYPAHNCTIVSDWSYGHIYRDLWNTSVMFSGNPSQPYEILDYMYYRNKTCDPTLHCVYVWHPRDYDILQSYVDKLGLHSVYQEKHKNIFISY
jgi:hypothetical protein